MYIFEYLDDHIFYCFSTLFRLKMDLCIVAEGATTEFYSHG